MNSTMNGHIKWKRCSDGGHAWSPQAPGESREFDRYLRFESSTKPNTSGKHYFLREGVEEWMFTSKMLTDQLTEALIGGPVKIVFAGKRTAKSGATYKHFDVYAPEAGE